MKRLNLRSQDHGPTIEPTMNEPDEAKKREESGTENETLDAPRKKRKQRRPWIAHLIMALSGPHGKMHRSWLEGVVDYIKVRARLKWELQPADARDLALELAGEFTRNPPEAKSSGLSGSIEIVAYVRRCVDNRMLDRRKKKKLKLETIGPDALKVAAEGFADPESNLQCGEIWALVGRVLPGMPPARQLAFRLCRLEGMEPEEAAVITGTKPETVRRQVYESIHQMRMAAEGLDILPEPTPARAVAKPKKQKRVITLPNPFKALGARLRRTEES